MNEQEPLVNDGKALIELVDDLRPIFATFAEGDVLKTGGFTFEACQESGDGFGPLTRFWYAMPKGWAEVSWWPNGHTTLAFEAPEGVVWMWTFGEDGDEEVAFVQQFEAKRKISRVVLKYPVNRSTKMATVMGMNLWGWKNGQLAAYRSCFSDPGRQAEFDVRHAGLGHAEFSAPGGDVLRITSKCETVRAAFQASREYRDGFKFYPEALTVPFSVNPDVVIAKLWDATRLREVHALLTRP